MFQIDFFFTLIVQQNFQDLRPNVWVTSYFFILYNSSLAESLEATFWRDRSGT